MSSLSKTGANPIPASNYIADANHDTLRRRRTSPETGKALEILGHAIEYLTDEFVHQGGSFSANNPQVEAIQLLMQINRQAYSDCPEVPTFGERCRALLHTRTL